MVCFADCCRDAPAAPDTPKDPWRRALFHARLAVWPAYQLSGHLEYALVKLLL
jgi:hypothetical protein